MKRLSFLMAGLFLAASLVAGGPSVATALVEGPDVRWNLSSWGKEREFTQAIEGISAYVSEKTGGRFTIKIHYGGALSKPKENLDGIKLGAFEMAMFCASYHPAKTPSLTVLQLPFVYDNVDQVQRAHQGIYAHPYVQKDLARWNAKPLMSCVMPPQIVFGRGEAPLKAEDWKGKRVRALGGMGAAFKALGAIPTTVTAPETYTALERGTIDAAVFTIGSGFSFGVAEVSEWYTPNLGVGLSCCPIVVGVKAFNALPPQYQDVLMDSIEPAFQRIKAAWAAGDKKNIPILESTKKKIVYDDATLAAIKNVGGKPIWDAWIKENAGKGLPAQELFDLMMRKVKGQ